MIKVQKRPVSGWGWALVLLALGACSPAPQERQSPVPQDTPTAVSAPEPGAATTPPQEENLGQQLPITARVNIHGTFIDLEVAETVAQQEMGLMYRTYLAGDRGMLFSFKPAQITRFWMKNTKIPLDMVFIHRGKVVAIADNVPPCTQEPCAVYGPDRLLVDQVIELRAGRAAELKLKVGDGIAVEFFSPKTSQKP